MHAAISLGEIRTPEQGYAKVDEFRQVVRDSEAVTAELYESSMTQLAALKPRIEQNDRERRLNLAIGIPLVLLSRYAP